MPVVRSLSEFDSKSGSIVERLIFNNRVVLSVICLLLTLFLGYKATDLTINASFDDMMPNSHSFVQNYRDNATSLGGLGNSVRIVVENVNGNIYDPEYLQTLKEINDKVFLIPGVDRSFMKSLWMPVVRWTEITEEGYKGGSVMPDTYDGSAESIEALRFNVNRSGIIGSLVANNQKSSMIFMPLVEIDASTGQKLDYKEFRDTLYDIREEYESRGVKIHVIGFAQLVGDLIHGMLEVFTYFFYAAVITTFIIYIYTRCVRSTILVVLCSVVAVIWQLGLMQLAGMVLDPYSVLVPFLIFAIGVSHGAQKMNGIMQDIGRGTHKYVAARYTFRRLFLAGLTALVADAVGFAVLTIIDIPVIRGLAISASIGVAVLIFTNLILLPIMLSYSSVSPKAAARTLRVEAGDHPFATFLGKFTERKYAYPVLAMALLMTIFGLYTATKLQIGDLDAGAPELRPDSTYNKDNAFITSNYQLSSDQFAVIVRTKERGLVDYATMLEIDRLEEIL